MTDYLRHRKSKRAFANLMISNRTGAVRYAALESGVQ